MSGLTNNNLIDDNTSSRYDNEGNLVIEEEGRDDNPEPEIVTLATLTERQEFLFFGPRVDRNVDFNMDNWSVVEYTLMPEPAIRPTDEDERAQNEAIERAMLSRLSR